MGRLGISRFLAGMLAVLILATVTSVPIVAADSCPPGSVCWTGDAGDGRWESVANWSGDAVPASYSKVLISLPFAGQPVVTISSAPLIKSLLIGSGVTLSCVSACSLRVEYGGAQITNSGVIANHGSIQVLGGGAGIVNSGIITNSGTVSVEGGSAYITNSADGTITNSEGGRITVFGGGAKIENHGTITNFGTIEVSGGGATIMNENQILNCAGNIIGTVTGNEIASGCESTQTVTTLSTTDHVSESMLSAYGAANVDGILESGEYASCVGPITQDVYTFIFCASNDNTNTYFAFKINDLTNDASAVSGKADFVSIFFDNNNDGKISSCASGVEDTLGLRANNVFGDSNICMSGTKLVGGEDTTHGRGVVKFAAGAGYVYEISHPLDSGDSKDYSLFPGDALGYCLAYNDASTAVKGSEAELPTGCVTPTSSGSASGYGNIIIAAGSGAQPGTATTEGASHAGTFTWATNVMLVAVVALIAALSAFLIYRKRRNSTGAKEPSAGISDRPPSVQPAPEFTSLKCRECGSPVLSSQRFCMECGADLSSIAGQGELERDIREPSKYVASEEGGVHALTENVMESTPPSPVVYTCPRCGWLTTPDEEICSNCRTTFSGKWRPRPQGTPVVASEEALSELPKRIESYQTCPRPSLWKRLVQSTHPELPTGKRLLKLTKNVLIWLVVGAVITVALVLLIAFIIMWWPVIVAIVILSVLYGILKGRR